MRARTASSRRRHSSRKPRAAVVLPPLLLAVLGSMAVLGTPGPAQRDSSAAAAPPAGPYKEGARTPGSLATGAKELKALRTANSRTYRRPGGTLVAKVSSDAVNYRRGGRWLPIDNELKPVSGGYENGANAYSLHLPQNAAGRVSFRAGEDAVSFKLLGADAAADVEGNHARYVDALPGVTAAYSAEPSSVKETLTLRGREAPSSFTFRLQTSPRLRAREAADGGIDFKHDGKLAFRFAPPFMQDQTSGPAGTSHAVRLELTGAPGKQTVRLTADRRWLRDPARRYPVVIDPTIERSCGQRDHEKPTTYYCSLNGANQDCGLVGGASANTDFCGNSYFDLMWDGTRAGRALLKFDLAGVVPRDAEVLHSRLELYLRYRWYAIAVPVTAHRVTRAWSGGFNGAGATWNRYDGTNAWTSPGGDFDPAVAATANVGAAAGSQYWYPTELVEGWVNGGVANHGLLLKTPQNVRQLLRFDASAPNAPVIMPSLTVEYVPRTGDLPRYWLETQTLQEGLELSVNPASGNLLVRQTDFELSETDLDYGIERSFNGLSPHREQPNTGATLPFRPMGPWHMNVLDVSLSFKPGGAVIFDGPSGYGVRFDRQPDGSYRARPGVGLELVWDGVNYVITDTDTDETYRFGPNGGSPTRKTDPDGGQIDYTYTNGRLTSLSDNLGRQFTFRYDAYGRLTHMTDPANGVHWYEYYSPGIPVPPYQQGRVGDEPLLAHTAPNGQRTSFGYNGGRLDSITPPGAPRHRFTYDTRGRVTAITEVTDPSAGTGPTTTWSYGDGTTTRTEPGGRTTTYTYDHTGMVTSSVTGTSPPALTLSGSLYDARGTTLSPSNTYAMHYDASDPSGIAQAAVSINREDVQDGGEDCVSACGDLAGDLEFDPLEEGKGRYIVRVFARDTEGDVRSQTFRVEVPTLPPPPELPADQEPIPAPDEPIAPDLCEQAEGVGSQYCAQEEPTEPFAALGSPLAAASAPPAGAARLVYGISDPDKHAENYLSPEQSYLRKEGFQALRVKTLRIILPYNLMEWSWGVESFRRFYKDALDRGYEIMVSFAFKCHNDSTSFGECFRPDNQFAEPPPRPNYVDLMKLFARRFPRVKWISAWNEPNFRQPVEDYPERVAKYTYYLDRDVCSRPRVPCDVVAADLSQRPRDIVWLRWLRRYGKQLKALYDGDSFGRTHYPRHWGFHPYFDVDRYPQRQKLAKTGTHAFISAIRKNVPAISDELRVWFTEVGSRIDYKGRSRPRNTLASQAGEVRYLVDRLALYRGVVDRIYYYQYCAGLPEAWDSGLTGGPETLMPRFPDCTEPARPAYDAYKERTLLNPKP